MDKAHLWLFFIGLMLLLPIAILLPGTILARQYTGQRHWAEVLARSLFFYVLMVIKLVFIPLAAGLRAIGIILQWIKNWIHATGYLSNLP